MKNTIETCNRLPHRLRVGDVPVMIVCILSVFLLSACPSDISTGDVDTNLSFSVSGAKAIAGYSAQQASASITGAAGAHARDTAASSMLVKITEDNSVEAAISCEDGYSTPPDVAFISVGNDGSVYICFSYPYQYWNLSNNTTTSMQLIRVYPDNHFDVLWPLDPNNYDYNSDGTVAAWTWWGMDSDPLQKGDDGQIYFKVANSEYNTENHSVYSYDPDSGEKPVLRTPSNAMIYLESFKVDSAEHLFIKGSNPNSYGSYLRYYTPGVVSPTNIYYTSIGDIWVRGYSPTPAGDALIMNGYNILGLFGIIRANIDGTSVTYDHLYQNNYELYGEISFENVGEMIWAPDGSLYGLYDNYWWGGANSGTKVLRLLDPAGDVDFEVIPLNHGGAIPSKIKYIDGYLYYRYSVMDGGNETGYHKLARLNIITEVEEEVLADSYLASRDLEILSYDASTDNSILYFSALDYQTNSVIMGKIDLATKAFSEIPASTLYNMVRTF